MESVAVTRFACGSIFVTVPSPVFGTQTAPSPTAAIAGRCPTAITASAAPEGNGDADELALDPAGAHPVIAASSTNAAIHVPRPVALLNMDLGNEVASGGGGRRPLIDADQLQGRIARAIETHGPHHSRVGRGARHLGQHLATVGTIPAGIVDGPGDCLDQDVGGIECLNAKPPWIRTESLAIAGLEGRCSLERRRIDADDGVIGSSRQSAGGPRVLVVGQRIAA